MFKLTAFNFKRNWLFNLLITIGFFIAMVCISTIFHNIVYANHYIRDKNDNQSVKVEYDYEKFKKSQEEELNKLVSTRNDVGYERSDSLVGVAKDKLFFYGMSKNIFNSKIIPTLCGNADELGEDEYGVFLHTSQNHKTGDILDLTLADPFKSSHEYSVIIKAKVLGTFQRISQTRKSDVILIMPVPKTRLENGTYLFSDMTRQEADKTIQNYSIQSKITSVTTEYQMALIVGGVALAVAVLGIVAVSLLKLKSYQKQLVVYCTLFGFSHAKFVFSYLLERLFGIVLAIIGYCIYYSALNDTHFGALFGGIGVALAIITVPFLYDISTFLRLNEKKRRDFGVY